MPSEEKLLKLVAGMAFLLWLLYWLIAGNRQSKVRWQKLAMGLSGTHSGNCISFEYENEKVMLFVVAPSRTGGKYNPMVVPGYVSVIVEKNGLGNNKAIFRKIEQESKSKWPQGAEILFASGFDEIEIIDNGIQFRKNNFLLTDNNLNDFVSEIRAALPAMKELTIQLAVK